MREGIIIIGSNIHVPISEVKMKTIRSGGPGGQHVNKVETAVQLQFDLIHSSLPAEVIDKIIAVGDKRISKEGVFILKCDEYRSQKKNREEAIERLISFIRPYTRSKRPRIKSRPTKSSLERKKKYKMTRSQTKSLRRKPTFE